MKKLKKLCPDLVQRLGEVKEKRKGLEDEEKTLVGIAKETWDEVDSRKRRVKDENGNVKTTYTYSPKDSEFQAVLSVFKKRDAKWKELFEEFYTKEYGKKAFKKFVAKLPKTECTQLDITRKED